jgi:hypothetical protein
MKTLSQTQLELLKKPLPAEAVSQHPTKTYLSSIKAIYVTERLNEVFGVGAWRTKVRKECDGTQGMVVVHVTFEVPEYNIYYECFGGNDNGGENSKNFDLGDAYKGATTDAITKIGSYLGIGIDVFKGKVKSSAPTSKPNTNTPEPDKWLNQKDKQGNVTKQWENVVEALKKGKINSVADVRKFYKVSKQTETELQEIIDFINK